MINKSLILFLFFVCVEAFASDKVTICHVPPGNPGNAQTITISRNALRGHMDNQGRLHGLDYMGECQTQSSSEFYACNAGIKHGIEYTTETSHDYLTYSFEQRSGASSSGNVLEAKMTSYVSAFSRVEAFSKKLTSVNINLSSEKMGADYFIDFCFDGRSAARARGLRIEDVTYISSSPFPIKVAMELHCDIHNRENGRVELSKIPLDAGFPVSFRKVPEYCLLRFHVLETNVGEARNWSRSFNRITTLIESEIISQ